MTAESDVLAARSVSDAGERSCFVKQRLAKTAEMRNHFVVEQLLSRHHYGY